MKKKNSSGFREIEHKADRAIEAWAPDLQGLFVQAAAGMHTLMGIEMLSGPMVTHQLLLEGMDRESLLVSFLSELLYLIDTCGLACEVADFQFSETALRAHLIAKPILKMQRQIKAVTFHNLEIKNESGLLSVTLIFDV